MIMRFLSAIILIFTLVACTGNKATTTLAGAMSDFNAGDYSRAQSACDRIMSDSACFNRLDVTQLCTLAELYVRLDSANIDSSASVAESNEAMAVRCLSRARSIDADSVEMFISSRPRERASRLAVINIVSTYLAIPRDSLVVEDVQIYDSI